MFKLWLLSSSIVLLNLCNVAVVTESFVAPKHTTRRRYYNGVSTKIITRPSSTTITTNSSSSCSSSSSSRSSCSHLNASKNKNDDKRPTNLVVGRKKALEQIIISLSLVAQATTAPQAAQAKTSIKPDSAFQSLLAAREELSTAQRKFLPNRDYDGMRDYFADNSLNINLYEENANALLASKALDAESKKEIGTIRRYGVGADVMIMYGSLRAEIDEENESPDYSTVSKSLQRTADSLDEVIAICRSNGL